MFVIHPKDKTTAMLATLYEGLNAQVFTDNLSANAVGRLLHHVSSRERILLLGHGSESGLFYRQDDSQDVFDKWIVYHPHAYHLRKHGGNLVAIWCHADAFARKEGLHGLFSGMIISELSEAFLYGIETTQEELDGENMKLAQRLRSLFDEGVLLSEIPARMKALDDVRSPLTNFNYDHFYYF